MLCQKPPEEHRWKLRSIRSAVGEFMNLALSTVWTYLDRLGMSWQRGRHYVHSPDPHYADKWAYIQHQIATACSEQVVVLLADQLTYYNHASVGYDWKGVGQQPLAHTALGGTDKRRIAGLLNLATGQLTYLHRQVTKVDDLLELYEQALRTYAGKRLYIIVDNWPVHYHPDLLACLEVQQSPFQNALPASWKQLKAKGRYTKRDKLLPIQLLSLPTYASWLNPIEKVWRRLKGQVLHLHPYAQDFALLEQHVEQTLQRWQEPSQEMLSYCGLTAQQGLYTKAREAYLSNTA